MGIYNLSPECTEQTHFIALVSWTDNIPGSKVGGKKKKCFF